MINTSNILQRVKSVATSGIVVAAITTSSVVIATSTPSAAWTAADCNCVLYARSQVRSLPSGLTTLEDKKRIINSRQASVGAVAIIDSGYIVNRINYGHVAVVREVKPDGTIRIEESNWRGCGVGSRNGTPAQLKILGYFKP